ncbi:hypothetical protein BDR22DRAFT_697223 [Usnea florida]
MRYPFLDQSLSNTVSLYFLWKQEAITAPALLYARHHLSIQQRREALQPLSQDPLPNLAFPSDPKPQSGEPANPPTHMAHSALRLRIVCVSGGVLFASLIPFAAGLHHRRLCFV